LSDALLDLSIKLSIAAAQMADLADAGNTSAFRRAKVEIEKLRDECDNARSELDRHRAKHGC